MGSITILVLGATCGYLAGNPVAMQATFRQLQKISGMAIDGLNRQGGNDVQKSEPSVEQSDD